MFYTPPSLFDPPTYPRKKPLQPADQPEEADAPQEVRQPQPPRHQSAPQEQTLVQRNAIPQQQPPGRPDEQPNFHDPAEGRIPSNTTPFRPKDAQSGYLRRLTELGRLPGALPKILQPRPGPMAAATPQSTAVPTPAAERPLPATAAPPPSVQGTPPVTQAAAQLENARKAGAVIEGGRIIPHPDGQGGLLHHTGFALTALREHPAAGTSVPYRDDHGRQHQIPVQGMRRITDPSGRTHYHFMVGGKPVSVPEGATPLFQIDTDGKRYTQTPDGNRRELGYDRMAAAQAGIAPREAAARKALDQTLARGAEHYGGFIEEYRRRQADIHQYKTAAVETPQDAEWQKTARSAQGDPRTWDTQLIAEVEKRDPAKAAAMRQALLPQPTKRLFDAAEKSFAGADVAGGQPAPEASDSVTEKSMTLHEMLMQAPAMTQGQGEHQPPVDQAEAARSTAQHALGISDPENVRVTRSADGTYTLSRPAADGSGTHQPFATLDPRTNRLTLIPGPDGQHGQAAISMVAKGAPHGTPIYLPGSQPPLSASERSDLIAKGIHATSTTTDRQQADAALTQAGLSPEGIRQLVNEGRLSVQDGKFLNDKFNGGVSSYATHSAAAPPQPQAAKDKTNKLTPESQAEQLRLREANEQFLHQQFPQVPLDELRRNYNTYRDDFVRKNYDLPDGVDDKTFNHLNGQKQEREKQEVETALKAQQVGFKAALDDLGSLKGLTQRQQDGPGAGKDAQHFFKGYHAAFAVFSKHRDLLQTLSESIERSMTGKAREGDAAALASAREKLIDLPDEERRIVLAALHNEAQKRGAVIGAAKGGTGYAAAAKQLLHGLFTAGMTKDGSSFWQQTGEAGWRILESGISGNSHANTLEVLKSVPTTGRVTFTGDIRTAEDARRFVEAEMIHAHAVNASVAGDGPAILPREGSELTLTPEQTRLIEDAKNRLARGVRMAQEISALGSDVDPIPNLFASTLGSSAAMMGLMAASRGAAAPFIASLYKGAAYEELSLKYPEASHEAKLKAATLSAVIQTAGDYVGVKAFSGLNIGKLLANPQGLTAAVIGRGLGRAGLSYGVENGVEAGQDIATPAIIEALKLDFPGFDWEQEKKNFWKGRADVAIGMLPLTLLGLGAASVKDYANSKALLSDDAMLRRQGLPKNYRKDIIEAAQRGDTATAQRLLQEGFKQRDPAIAAQSQGEMDKKNEASTPSNPTNLQASGTETTATPGTQAPAFLVVKTPNNTTLSTDENARRPGLAADQNRDPARLLEGISGDDTGGTAGGTERGHGEIDQAGRSHMPEVGQGRGDIPILDEERLRAGLSNLEEAGGAEHKVFFDHASSRAVKLTNPGELGAEERGLSGYLQRLAWHNELLGDHITVEGWVKMPGERTERLVTTQPLRVPDPQRPEPTQKEIDVYMRAHGFLRAYDGAYIHESRDIAASDAVPKNFVREKSGEIHPVDVLLVQPSESMHSRLTAMAYNEPQVPKSALPAKPGATPDDFHTQK